MTEDVQVVGGAEHESITETVSEKPTPTPSAGTQLRTAREAAGLHIAALAVALKVPTRKLEALEADRYDELPGVTFTRALASSVCRQLKVDPLPVLAQLPSTEIPKLHVRDDGVNAPFHKPGDLVTMGETWQKLRITVISVVVLLLGSVLIYSIPQAWINTQSKVVQTVVLPKAAVSVVEMPIAPASAPQDLISAVVSAVPPSPTGTIPSVQVSASATGVIPAATRTQMVTSTQTMLVMPRVTPTLMGMTVASAAPNNADIMVFEAKADTWIEVLDRDSQILVRRVLKAGEKQPVQGKPPLMVSVGNADKTRVMVRGKNYDLASVTRENVARFTVN